MAQFDAVINLRATDNASPVVDAATKNILNNWKVMRQEIRSVTAEFQLQNQTLVAAQGVFRSIGSIAGSLMNIFTQFNTMQIRVTNANNSLILAQMHYNQVLAEEGPGTNDAIAASIQLQEAKQEVAQATQQETLQYIGMGLELGTTVSQMISAIPNIKRFIDMLKNAKTAATEASAASTAASAASAATSVATTAAGAAGAGAAGVAAKTAPSILARIGSAAARAAPGAGVAAGGVMLLSMMGQQQAGETSVPTGLDALKDIFLRDLPDKINQAIQSAQNFFGGGNNSNQQVEHVVTVKVMNATDHLVTAQETSMGIQQVYGSHQ